MSSRKNKSKASQGGLTSPKLSDSGLDFRIAVAKNTEGRQVRISCINVTDRLSSVVFISHPNQLQICHTSRFVESQVLQKCFRESLQECHCCKNVCQVWQKCFTESVAEMSLWQECHTSRFVESQVAKMSRCKNVTLGSESDLPTPAWENDPSVGNSPVGISLAPVGIKSG